MTDYDTIRALCKLPVTFGTPEPEPGYVPRRNGTQVTLRYTVPVTVGGFSTSYTYPVSGQVYYRGDEWVGVPPRDKLPKVGDVLSCLLLDAQVGSYKFDEFCDALGYDFDSRKAFDTYLKCRECLGAMRKAFGADLEQATELARQL